MSILFLYILVLREQKCAFFFPGCCKWSLGSSTLPCDIYVYTITSWLYPAANPTRDSTLCVSHGSLRPVQRQLELCNSIQTAALVYNVIFLFSWICWTRLTIWGCYWSRYSLICCRRKSNMLHLLHNTLYIRSRWVGCHSFDFIAPGECLDTFPKDSQQKTGRCSSALLTDGTGWVFNLSVSHHQDIYDELAGSF